MEKLLLPQNFEDIKIEKNKYGYENYGKFAIYPFERGFGHTIGNSLRRILLSSLEGAAITNCRINNVLHEFTTIPGVKEDVIYILMNLKKIRFKLYSDGPEKIKLSVRGSKEKTIVTAGDFQVSHNLDIINKDEYIAEIDSRAYLEIEAEVEKGRGYMLAEANKLRKSNKPVGTLFIDSIFSPIIKVNYEVEDVRVGEKTNYDKLIMEVWSDGSISPKDALIFAAKILRDNVDIFFKASTKSLIDKIVEESDFEITKQERLKDLLSQPIDILELSNRPKNCLKNANIETIGQLVSMTEEDLKNLQNLGEKSLEEIKQKLKEKNLSLGMKL
ncbi:MAG: DNA-directed RNA polymerase subunit alpha [Elusimicrobiota bacterium]|nr:DNA-directed RNA polymerase subunit alpha [Endomicrobiia bacterium]MDW8165483.1 DNA-directed RNA polymerase subunit alpha [Elusimicrobiota bacterium]